MLDPLHFKAVSGVKTKKYTFYLHTWNTIQNLSQDHCDLFAIQGFSESNYKQQPNNNDLHKNYPKW